MKVAQAKLEMIKPEEVNLEEYEVMYLLRGWAVQGGVLTFTDLLCLLRHTWREC